MTITLVETNNINQPKFITKNYTNKTLEDKTEQLVKSVFSFVDNNIISLNDKIAKYSQKEIHIPNHFNQNSANLFSSYKITHLIDEPLTIFNDGENNLGIIKDYKSYSIALVFVENKKVLFTIQSKRQYEPALASGKLICSSKNINKNLLIERLYNLFNDVLVEKND